MLRFVCTKCNREFEHWFQAAGRMQCKTCDNWKDALSNGKIESEFDQEQLKSYRLAKAKHFRDYSGRSFCMHCGEEQFDEMNNRQPLSCNACFAVNRRLYRQLDHVKASRAKEARAVRNKNTSLDDVINRLLAVLRRRASRLDWPLGEPIKKVCWIWSKPGLSQAEKYRIQYNADPEFQLAERMRRQINKNLKRDGIGDIMRDAIKRNGESSKVQLLLGYSIAELKSHLESQFTPDMNWSAFMAGRIHIDHKIPQKLFDLSKEEEWRECWSLSNLQPLWAEDNLFKSSRLISIIR